MNDDRCRHVPPSPGQSVCQCLHERMELRFLVQLQARRIADVEADAQRGRVTYPLEAG